jgi:hypothetical protein
MLKQQLLCDRHRLAPSVSRRTSAHTVTAHERNKNRLYICSSVTPFVQVEWEHLRPGLETPESETWLSDNAQL